MTNTTLLLIDVQNDFHPGGSLAIPTANEDAARIASLISRSKTNISRIIATLDSHHYFHVANTGFWKSTTDGTSPAPFTLIKSEDLKAGKWTPTIASWNDKNKNVYAEADHVKIDKDVFANWNQVVNEEGQFDLQKYCVEYTKMLEAKGRFHLIIWPNHCIMGTEGHNVVPSVMKAMTDWIKTTEHSIEWVHKGMNNLTEMYSALKAEVPVTKSTLYNEQLLQSLQKSDRVLVAGQALSHCVNYTVRDIVERWDPDQTSKICILTDCCSPVPGFEEAGETFLKDMKEKGVTLCTSEEAFD